MFRNLRRVMSKALKLTRPAKLAAAAWKVQSAATKALTVAKPKRTVKSKAASARRAPLGETLRRISAGGMPKHPKLPRAKAKPPRGARFVTAQFASEHGKRSYKLYLPAQAAPGATAMPLVIMLHGCTQTPDDFAVGTGMNRLADERGVLVAFPAQPAGANRNKCWNWFRPSDQGRDRGEPALIAGIVQQILRDHPADPERVYIAGLSAGGAAAAIIAAAYPDIFAATGVHSGLPVGAAQDPVSALIVMRTGSLGSRLDIAVPTIIFHGDADDVVNPRNGRAVAAQSVAAFPALSAVDKPGKRAGGHRYVKTAHRGDNRKSYCEHWVIEGAGHAWSGGDPAGSFTDPAGPDASREMLRFFLQHRLSPKRGVA